MSKKGRKGFAEGDVVVLRSGLTRTAAGLRTCRIASVLPAADRGERQYRVQFENETFERRVVESDIEMLEKAAAVAGDVAAAGNGKSWLKPLRSKSSR